MGSWAVDRTVVDSKAREEEQYYSSYPRLPAILLIRHQVSFRANVLQIPFLHSTYIHVEKHVTQFSTDG